MTNIYVGNLSYETSQEDLEAAFNEFGAVEKVNIVKDRDTGQPRGFAFVEMTNRNEASTAIAALNGRNLHGRDLSVNEARPREERSGGRPGGGGGGRGGFKRAAADAAKAHAGNYSATFGILTRSCRSLLTLVRKLTTRLGPYWLLLEASGESTWRLQLLGDSHHEAEITAKGEEEAKDAAVEATVALLKEENPEFREPAKVTWNPAFVSDNRLNL